MTLNGGVPDGDELPRLMDWFIHEYKLRRYGKTLVQLFSQEKGGDLSEGERRILDGWLAARLGLYEVTRVEEGNGVGLRDVFTGEEFFARDVSASREVVRWDLLFVRVVPEREGFGLGDVALRLGRTHKEAVVSLGQGWFEAYRKENPDASWAEFMTQRGYMFNSVVAVLESREGPGTLDGSGG